MSALREHFLERLIREFFLKKGSGFVLKGGGAVRTLFGEQRLTKDIDLDFTNPKRTAESLHNTVNRAIAAAARGLPMQNLRISTPRKGELSPRWKINFSNADGEAFHVEVEVSRDPERAAPGAVVQKRFSPGTAIGIGRFWVDIYDEPTLIATKLAALLGREAPLVRWRPPAMSSWRPRMVQVLSAADAPPVLNRDLLKRYARSARGGNVVPDSTLSWWTRRAVEENKLQPLQRGLYLNRFRAAPGRLADAITSFHSDAVVSLNTVLGDAGVLNNPARTVTAVVPIDAGYPPPQLGRKQTKAGIIHFFGLPRRILEAGKPLDRLERPDRFDHPRATPEKALIDWLYLARSVRSNRTSPARGDIDLELLRRRRLRRLAKAAGVSDALDSWLALE